MKQEFRVGDLVHIKKELPECMSHFTNDKDAIVTEYSHNSSQAGSDWEHDYQIYIKGQGTSAWYNNSNLDLIEHNRSDMLELWEKEQQNEIDLKSNIDWIFENSEAVLKEPHGSSISKLAECFGLNNLWGLNGEGFVWYQNSMQTLALAEPFLKANNKKGWLDFCVILKAEMAEAR